MRKKNLLKYISKFIELETLKTHFQKIITMDSDTFFPQLFIFMTINIK